MAAVATAEEAEENRGGWWTGEPRKLAVLFYRAMTRGLDYVERGLAECPIQVHPAKPSYPGSFRKGTGSSTAVTKDLRKPGERSSC